MRSQSSGFLRRAVLATATLLALSAAAQTSRPVEPADEPDAVVNLWRQHWTKNADGSIVYHERKEVTINTDRAHRDFADPRIGFDSTTQTVEVISARTRLPGGKTIEVPAYSRTEVAPGWASGWPAYARYRQLVMVMSGIEHGCVAELEYKVKTKAGAHSLIANDLLLQDRYPIRRREIRIDLPSGDWLRPWLTGLTEQTANYAFEQHGDGTTTHTWVIPELPVLIDEPAAPPRQTRAARLTFATSAKPDEWLSEQLHALFDLSEPGEDLKKVSNSWTVHRSGTPQETIRGIHERLARTFNFVDVDAVIRQSMRRTADDVLRGNYGTSTDAAVMMLSLARASGLKAQPVIVLRDDTWVDKTPQDALISDYAVAIPGESALEFWHPQLGRMQRGARWNACTLVTAAGEAGPLERITWPAWSSAADSRASISGELTVTADASLTGKLTIRLTGFFVNAEALREADAQKSRIRDVLKRLSPSIDVQTVTIRSLTPDTFESEVLIKSTKPIEATGDLRRLTLGPDGVALADIDLPLAQSNRTTPVLLPAAFEQRVDIVLNWAPEWTVEASPADKFAVTGEWGSATSDTDLNSSERKLRLTREIRLPARELTSAQWLAATGPLNGLRKESARTVLLRKSAEKR